MTATPALAEVCDKVREDWLPSSGPVGFGQELLATIQALPILVPIAVLLAMFTLSARYLAWLSAAPVLAFWFMHPYPDPDWGTMQAARVEGCVGPYSASMLPYLVLSGAMLLRAAIMRPVQRSAP